MNKITHPFSIIEKISEIVPYDSTFFFSIYEYEPQSILDQRTIFDITSNALSDDFFFELRKKLQPNEEIAIHSKIMINKKLFHIPMIDFCCTKEALIEHKSSLSNLIPKEICSELSIYDSGNSLHGYSLRLIKNSDWTKYIGRLLLANLPNQTPIVDSRWIGHRLMAGYCSLRLSNNSGHYKKEPTYIDHFQKI